MKNKISKAILLCGFTPLLMGVTTKASSKYIHVTTDTFGPFEKRQEDVDIDFHIIFCNQDVMTGIYEQLIVGTPERPNASVARKKSHSVSNLQEYVVTFTLPLSYYFDEDGISVTFRILNSESVMYSKTVELYPPGNDVISPFDYVTTRFVSKPLVARFNQTKAVYSGDKLLFKNYTPYFTNDVYHRLRLDQFTFTLDTLDDSFSHGESSMTILSKNELFPKYPIGIVYTKLTKNGSKIDISFQNILYVEPKQLTMSFVPLPGYKSTKYFYLPVNKMDEIYGMELAFEIKNIGYNKTTIRWNMTYEPTTHKVGNCYDSEYCVVGGVKK